MEHKVTGSIVTYNNMNTIKKTLETLFEFTKDIDFKLYVADNGSVDGTPEFIEKNFPQVELIRTEKNLGFGAGHNVIINKIDSQYHAVINPDIVMIENAIKNMSDFLDENTDIGLLSPRITFPDGREQILGKRKPHFKYLVASRLRGNEPGKLLKEYAMLDEDLSKPVDIENATGCFMMFRTETLKKVGGFDERYFMYFEDSDITRSIKKVSRAVYYPYTTVNHVWSRESKRNTKLMLIHMQSMVKYYAKWKMV